MEITSAEAKVGRGFTHKRYQQKTDLGAISIFFSNQSCLSLCSASHLKLIIYS